MARRKRKLEAIEALDRSDIKPRGLSAEDIKDIQHMINSAWQNRSRKITESRSLAEIVSDIENDEGKSRTRKDFEIHLASMADRITHSKRGTPVSADASQSEQASDSELLPLHERIRFLRERLH